MNAPPATFVVMVITPERVDHLILSKQQQRYVSQRRGSDWLSTAVQP